MIHLPFVAIVGYSIYKDGMQASCRSCRFWWNYWRLGDFRKCRRVHRVRDFRNFWNFRINNLNLFVSLRIMYVPIYL